MKKIIALFSTLALLVGCSAKPQTTSQHKYTVVTSIFPIYSWVSEITKGVSDVQVDLLIQNGVDLHNYQATTQDIVKIHDADAFIYIGGPTQGWIKDVNSTNQNKDQLQLDLLESLGERVLAEEAKEGMQMDHSSHDHDEDEDHDEEHEGEEHDDHEHEGELDEHTWLSVKNAVIYVQQLTDLLSQMDQEHASQYAENAKAYTEKLNQLDQKITETVAQAPSKTIVVADRFALRYFVEDYGIDYYAAFNGCSAETEASFSTVKFLAEKINDLSTKNVVVIDGSDEKIAKAVIGSTSAKSQKTIMFDTMQAVTKQDIDEGKTYLNIMEKNVEVIKEALQ